MPSQDLDHITEKDKAFSRILSRADPRAIWTAKRMLIISGFLKDKQENAEGWTKRIWGFLLTLHKKTSVQRWRLKLLKFWYEWPRFHPQKTVVKQKLLLPNSLKKRLPGIKARFEESKKEMQLILALTALTILAGISSNLGFYVLLAIGRWLLTNLPVSPNFARNLVIIGFEAQKLITRIIMAITVTAYVYWAGKVVGGWWDYHKIVTRIKKRLRRF